MKRIMSLRQLGGLLALLLAGSAGAQPPADHTTDEHGIMHAESKEYPGLSHCTDCHGSDIRGGIGPSCYSCHTAYWRYFDPQAVTPPLDHTIVKDGVQHKPGHIDPMNGDCTLCHGENLNDGFAPSCYTCHEPIWAGSGPPSDHTESLMGFAEHKPGYDDPFANGCTQCHGPNLDDGFAFSCFTCHDNKWSDNQPPQIDAGGPYQVSPGASITIDASGTVDPNGDPMTFEWTFGDGTAGESTGSGSSVSHVYATLGTYTGTVTVDDGVNPAVSGQFTVQVTDGPIEDLWIVNNTASPPETLLVTIEDHDGSLVIVMDDGVQSRLAYGIEFDRVIFWMELWMELGETVTWGVGDMYFGNIDRDLGTMDGVLFDREGRVYTFTGVAQ